MKPSCDIYRRPSEGGQRQQDVAPPNDDATTRLRQELDKLRESLNVLQLRNDRKMELLKDEIAEERNARQALQQQVEHLKKIVNSRLLEL